MWLFTRYGFYSAAVYKTSPEMVTVRARVREHLIELKANFTEFKALRRADVQESPKSDYLYRLTIPKDEWAGIVAAIAMEQEYNNFKDECQRVGGHSRYVQALHEVWWTMLRTQDKASLYGSGTAGHEDSGFGVPAIGQPTGKRLKVKQCPKCKIAMKQDKDKYGFFFYCRNCKNVVDG